MKKSISLILFVFLQHPILKAQDFADPNATDNGLASGITAASARKAIVVPSPSFGSSNARKKFFEMKARPNTQKRNYAATQKYLPYYDFHVFEAVYDNWFICFFAVEKSSHPTHGPLEKNTRFVCSPQPPKQVSFPPVGGSIGIGNLDLTGSFSAEENLQDYPSRITIEYPE